MTIIVAYKDSLGGVHIAADSRISGGNTFGDVGTPKIFKKGPYLFGFCGTIWPQQAIQCALEIPTIPPPMGSCQEGIEWVMKQFFFPIRKTLVSFVTGIEDPHKEAFNLELFSS